VERLAKGITDVFLLLQGLAYRRADRLPFGTVTSVVCGSLLGTLAPSVPLLSWECSILLVAWFEQPATVKEACRVTASQSLRWIRDRTFRPPEGSTLGVNRRRLLWVPFAR